MLGPWSARVSIAVGRCGLCGHSRVTHLVVVVEVDPAAQPLDRVPPLLAVPHHDGTALGVVLLQAHLHDGGFARDAELLVDFMFNGQAMGVPAETPLDVEALHGPVSRDDVLDGRSKEMAVVGEAGRERGAIVECVVGVPLGQLNLQRISASIQTRNWASRGARGCVPVAQRP